MSIESEVAALTTATTDLLDAVLLQKDTLDDAVAAATEQAQIAQSAVDGSAALRANRLFKLLLSGA